ncbi:hypothetical protein BRYFOR_09667 [Marvinbryantia formatexigens DSM 14469]|uniref:Uncharacterized protein n=1 Tax=Marvinbryantia formatexigens DSM 14469 TaxID=478749 RepID=C6LLW8_9FIRM|nr:hypothetical protein BRYFOR_09667 [Marvinbryantia formatexigens DSM 14469]
MLNLIHGFLKTTTLTKSRTLRHRADRLVRNRNLKGGIENAFCFF